MDFKDSPDEAAFRAEVRDWLQANARLLAPDEQPSGGVSALLSEGATGVDTPDLVARAQSWQRRLADGGWAGLTWPRVYGGRDLTPVQVVIFNEELAHFDVPPDIFGIGLGMIGPTLIAHGTEEQKQRYLPPMLSGEEIWCQLWSEPNAGSDLASLQTRAVDAEGWVLNGQKVWTSGAHYAHLGLIVARTDPDAPKHRGLTCFIVPMDHAGVEVRPLRQMTGGANFNEVFLSDVRVPDDNRVGDVNDGWHVALTVLMNERSSIAGGLNLSALADPLVTLAQKRGVTGDPHVRQLIADVYVRAKLLTLTGYRALTKLAKGSIPGPEGSIAKLVWSDLMTDIARRGLDLLGPAGTLVGPDAPDGGAWTSAHLMGPGLHLGGGTDEVMRNIIGERVLGLPKEPAPDKGLPFRELLVGMHR